MTEKQFYIVWCEERGEPTKKHDSFKEACAEAKRLSEKNPHLEYVVLKAIQSVTYTATPYLYKQYSKKRNDFEQLNVNFDININL